MACADPTIEWLRFEQTEWRNGRKGADADTHEGCGAHTGGQAVVGNVMLGWGKIEKRESTPFKASYANHADAPFDPLRSTDAIRDAVPVTRHA